MIEPILYPELRVDDEVQGGLITLPFTRLPLSAIVNRAIYNDWENTLKSFPSLAENAFTREKFARFLINLLEQRKEFARLLLILANATRSSEDEDFDWVHYAKYHKPVLDQLNTCIKTLQVERNS